MRDLVGHRFTHLIVLARAEGARHWWVECVCGRKKIIRDDILRAGRKSCGCRGVNRRAPQKYNKDPNGRFGPRPKMSRDEILQLRRSRYAEDAKHPEMRRYLQRARWESLQKRKGFSIEEIARAENAQDRRCAICRTRLTDGRMGAHTDHDHRTGKFRGVLCAACNLLLGRARDSIEILEAAATYLRTHQCRE